MGKLKSRKFILAVATVLFIALTEGLGLDIKPEIYWTLVSMAAAYILGEAYVDSKK